MAKFKFKKNSKLKKIVCAVLVIASVFALAVGVSAFAKNDTKTIGASAFSVGSLDENGKYVENKQAIYTQNAFECIGLRIAPDFEAKLTYDVYYYDYNEKLIEAKIGLTEVYDEDFPLAKLCRVVVHPAIPEGETARNFKIDFFEKYKFANELKITVDKNQNYLYSDSVNLYVAENAQLDKTFNSDVNTVTLTDSTGVKVSEEITVTGDYDYYDVFVKKTSEEASNIAVVIADGEENTILARELADLGEINVGEWCKITISVPDFENGAYLLVRMPSASECYVYGYNR